MAPVIETLKLTKFYGRDRGILDLDLTVEPGEIFGFIGPNGAGKSTTIRTLLGLIFPSSGSGRIFGLDIVRDSKALKREIGYVPAEVQYYHKMDVSELLEYSARFYGGEGGSRIGELAEFFALDLGRKIIDLSRGNQRKVSIIQSLLHRPRLLILDEPTSGLDPLMQAKFFDVLREEYGRGTTIFFSSHTLSEVQALCHRVGIIKQGRIIAVEDVESLRKKQLRKVRIEFHRPAAGLDFDIPGVVDPRTENNILSFLYSQPAPALIQALSGREVKDLLIEEPSLEEIFMHYYESGEEEG